MKLSKIAGLRVQASPPTIISLLQDVRGHTTADYKLATHVVAHYAFKLGRFSDDLYFYSTNDYEPSYKIGLKPYDHNDESVNKRSIVLRLMFNAINGHKDTQAVLADTDLLEDVIGDFISNFKLVSGIELELTDVVDLYLTLEKIAMRTEQKLERDIEKMVFICESYTLEDFKKRAVAVKEWESIEDFEVIWEAVPTHNVERILADPNNRQNPMLRGYSIGLSIEALRERINAILDENSSDITKMVVIEEKIKTVTEAGTPLRWRADNMDDSKPSPITANDDIAANKKQFTLISKRIEDKLEIAGKFSELLMVRLAQQSWLERNYDYPCLKIYGSDNIH